MIDDPMYSAAVDETPRRDPDLPPSVHAAVIVILLAAAVGVGVVGFEAIKFARFMGWL